MYAIRLLICLAAFAVTGCASRGPAPMQAAAPACGDGWNPQAAVLLSADPMRPTRHRVESSAAGCETVALFRLPRFREDWTLDVDSVFDGNRLFAPQVHLLDEQGKVLRELSFDRFSMRGERLQATLFFGAANSGERFLRVRAAPEVLGQTGHRVVSSSFVVPLVNAVLPLMYIQGTESEQSYTYADTGVLSLSARGASALRRSPQAHDVARSELGAFAR
jgi:hypothetical protein